MDEETRLRTLYVGGLAEEVTEEILRSVFIAFGDVKDVQIPQDFGTSAFWCAFAARAASALAHCCCLHNRAHHPLTLSPLQPAQRRTAVSASLRWTSATMRAMRSITSTTASCTDVC